MDRTASKTNNKTKDIISDHKIGGLQNEIGTIE
nr:MAG TPA: hypothetical protein [Caudoviricetes sp.]